MLHLIACHKASQLRLFFLLLSIFIVFVRFFYFDKYFENDLTKLTKTRQQWLKIKNTQNESKIRSKKWLICSMQYVNSIAKFGFVLTYDEQCMLHYTHHSLLCICVRIVDVFCMKCHTNIVLHMRVCMCIQRHNMWDSKHMCSLCLCVHCVHAHTHSHM